MGTVRNFIDIEGLSTYDTLPKIMKGQVVQISECENIQLPNTNLDIKNIFQIVINIEVTSTRTIETPINTLSVVDGVKNLKILYYDKSNKAGILDVKTPFNTFIELKHKKQEIKDIRIYVIDAYFQLLSSNMLYSHLLYYIDVDCSSDEKIKYAEAISTTLPENCNINYDIVPNTTVDLNLEYETTLSNNIENSIQCNKVTDFNNVINEISVSKDKITKVDSPFIIEEHIFNDKWSKFIDINQEYI